MADTWPICTGAGRLECLGAMARSPASRQDNGRAWIQAKGSSATFYTEKMDAADWSMLAKASGIFSSRLVTILSKRQENTGLVPAPLMRKGLPKARNTKVRRLKCSLLRETCVDHDYGRP